MNARNQVNQSKVQTIQVNMAQELTHEFQKTHEVKMTAGPSGNRDIVLLLQYEVQMCRGVSWCGWNFCLAESEHPSSLPECMYIHSAASLLYILLLLYLLESHFLSHPEPFTSTIHNYAQVVINQGSVLMLLASLPNLYTLAGFSEHLWYQLISWRKLQRDTLPF